MIDRYLLRYFLAVIDQGNFSKAADSCNVSQPTLSVGVAKLEKLLGRPLFHRTNRRVELTEAGVRFAENARRIEGLFAQAERDVQGVTAASVLRLGVLTTIPMTWIEAFIGRLAPQDRVEIVEGRERELIDRLGRSRIDAALTIIRNDGRFESEKLMSEGYSLAMSAHHPLAGHAVIDGAALADNPMIVRQHCELLSDTSRYFTARGVRPFFPARTTSDNRALSLVRAGLGVTVMPDCYQAPGVVRPHLADFAFSRDIGLMFAPHMPMRSTLDHAALRSLAETISERGGLSPDHSR